MSLISWVSNLFKKLLPAAQPAEPTSQRVEKSYKTFDERYEDPGVFQYNNEGFSIMTEKLTETIKWQDITKLNVYKVDLLTIDQIEMEIEYNNGNDRIRITEELPGWYQFVLKTKEIFPRIPQDWDLTIIHPAFERNYRTIYQRENVFSVEST